METRTRNKGIYKMSKKLVIAPHIDDELLGCGGILNKDFHVVYCGFNESHIPDRPSIQHRLKEADAVSKFLGFSYECLSNKINHYQVQDLIESFEKIINKYKPSEIYIPYPSYNQDHNNVYNAALIALRPHDKNHFVNTVLVYEQPQVMLWDYTHDINSSFKPNYFISIDIERKIEAYSLMASQVRSFRSPEVLRSMSMIRGHQSNCSHAEAFQTLRVVKK